MVEVIRLLLDVLVILLILYLLWGMAIHIRAHQKVRIEVEKLRKSIEEPNQAYRADLNEGGG